MQYVGSQCELIVAIPNEFSRSRGKISGGLATAWLQTLKEGDQVAVKISEGCLRPPNNSTAPLLMCGIGTGLHI